MQRRRFIKPTLFLAAALAIAAAPLAATAQPPGASWTGDVCQQQHAAGARGGLMGAMFGALFGWTIAGRRHRAAGAAAGVAAGAAAGRAIGGGSVACLAYPPRIETHEHNCRWVQGAYSGATQQFELCRDPDGVWRPSGRS